MLSNNPAGHERKWKLGVGLTVASMLGAGSLHLLVSVIGYPIIVWTAYDAFLLLITLSFYKDKLPETVTNLSIQYSRNSPFIRGMLYDAKRPAVQVLPHRKCCCIRGSCNLHRIFVYCGRECLA